jgi:diguanylate cyclase (GGDEF)-like protein
MEKLGYALSFPTKAGASMRSNVRDWRTFLDRWIPYHHLTPRLRRRIDRSLESGSEEDLRRATLEALEALTASEVYRREDASIEGDRVRLEYVGFGGGVRVVFRVRREEWEGLARSGTHPREERAEVTTIEVDAIPELARLFTVEGEGEELVDRLESVVAWLPRWLGFDRCRLMILGERLDLRGAKGQGVVALEEDELEARPELAWCRRRGEPLIFGGPEGRRGLAPLYTMGEFWGVLEVSWPPGLPEPRSRLQAAAEVVGQVVVNTLRLEHLISVDRLTRLYNRRFYDIQLPIEVERATRSGNPLAMLVVDLDDFKRINDTLGHRKGDEALRRVADLIRRNIRKVDLAFRYGGEEFVVLLPGTGRPQAIHTAERLRSVVATELDFHDDRGERYALTVSVGIAVFPEDARSAEELFQHADRALYLAKERGKNRVEMFRPTE